MKTLLAFVIFVLALRAFAQSNIGATEVQIDYGDPIEQQQ